jgi:hypothetical protein
MKQRSFLDIGCDTDADQLGITPQNGTEPDTDIGSNLDIADHMRIRCNPI